MIASQDRSQYFGASDTTMICGNWETKTFIKWWLTKLGLNSSNLKTIAMQAGNNFEHDILNSLDVKGLEKDKQIIKDRLRVNLDCNTADCIYEVKTYNAEKQFKVSKQYWRQVQVEMYALGTEKAYIVAYGLEEKDYKNFFNKIDKTRIEYFPIEYDRDFIKNEYKPKLEILTNYLKRGAMPCKLQEH